MVAKKTPRLCPRKAEAEDQDTFYDDDDDASAPVAKSTEAADYDNFFTTGDMDTGPPSVKKNDAVSGKTKPFVASYEESASVSRKGKKKKPRSQGNVDTIFKTISTSTKQKFGDKSVYMGSETDKVVICIPMFGGNGAEAGNYPGCLPLEFVIAQDGFPLGLILQLVGKPGCGKSALLAEIFRWFNLAGGGASLKEAESKFNPAWYRSIMGPFYEKLLIDRCDSVEDWQRKLTFAIKTIKTNLEGTKDEPGPGRTVPVCYGVDSIMGKASEETQEQIFGATGKKGKRSTPGDGAAGRGHPIEALKITRYMRSVSSKLDHWPFALVLVNHLRIKTDEGGNTERQKTGGVQVDFQESFELEIRKVGGHKKKIDCANFEGFPVEISCEKNSFGPTHRRIQTRMLWWKETDPATGKWRQKTIWDWDWSTVHMLSNMMQGERASPRIKEALKEIHFHLDCPATGEVENLAWSKSLGMTKTDALPWSDVGAMIREDAKLMQQLREALQINNRPLLAGDYLNQKDKLIEESP